MEIELENLKLILTSPRERAPGTITSYLQTGKVFLKFLNGAKMPTGEGEAAMREAGLIFRRFFLHRRENGIGERTLAKEFVQLNKLAIANSWPWPFTADDRPVPEEEPFAPAFTLEEIEILIKAREEYSKAECFYMVLSTTWGPRREEMIRITKRHYNEERIKIRIAKQKKKVKIIEHLIPVQINPILQAYHPKLININSLSYMFYRILDKAGLEQRKGYGWHSIRRTLETAIIWKLAENRLPPSLVADFMGWSKTRKGVVFGGAPMLGVYDHPEIMSGDPLAIDRLILNIHPFLNLWGGQQRLL